ncbi:hypothetical protein COCOBI_19-1980 [Coccomyxa sp. Obi]|nr:hypothetical protein COCOBI_19-1980 [Coccomyxa sp. Obi]
MAACLQLVLSNLCILTALCPLTLKGGQSSHSPPIPASSKWVAQFDYLGVTFSAESGMGPTFGKLHKNMWAASCHDGPCCSVCNE